MTAAALMLLVLAPTALSAQAIARLGARVRLTVDDRQRVIGRLVSVSTDSVLVTECDTCKAVGVSKASVTKVDASAGRESSMALTFVLGVAGAAAAAGLDVRLGRCHEGPCPGGLLLVPAIAVGGAIGSAVGRNIKSERWVAAVLPR